MGPSARALDHRGLRGDRLTVGGTGYPFWSLGLLASAVLHCTAVFVGAVLGLSPTALLWQR